jgi:hypothetical protein
MCSVEPCLVEPYMVECIGVYTLLAYDTNAVHYVYGTAVLRFGIWKTSRTYFEPPVAMRVCNLLFVRQALIANIFVIYHFLPPTCRLDDVKCRKMFSDCF